MIQLNAIALPLDAEAHCRGGAPTHEGPLVEAAAQALGILVRDICTVQVVKRNIDARRKSNVHFAVNVELELASSQLEASLVQAGKATEKLLRHPLDIPVCEPPDVPPVVVGTGPAGLFAALYLARAGCRPVVLERGLAVDERAQAVQKFQAGGELQLNANVQFGEGGAGTFSDGKLTTNIKHPLAPHVLTLFVEAGAPSRILWDARPHIGSDNLPAVVRAMREEIIERGGQVLFDARLTDVCFEQEALASIQICQAGQQRFIPVRQLVLACGHSARDTFEMLHQRGVAMERKPFSVGVRIEHPQKLINQAQWGKFAAHPVLGAAEYKLAWHGKGGRGAYTFCMCPGGVVMCAASEPEGVVTNGMSTFARDGAYANAGLLVNVDPPDLPGTHVLAGVEFQRTIERAAYQEALRCGGVPYQAPAQTVGDFLVGQVGHASTLVQPTYGRGVVYGDMRRVLPSFVCDALAQALVHLDAKLQGFAHPEAVLTAAETRSSSPVCIVRSSRKQALLEGADGGRQQPSGLFPCGEGAGFAGGIVSAACDGLAVAQQVVCEILARS